MSDKELTPDQVAYCHERAAERRKVWAEYRASGWQPIKTAPNDGTIILISDGSLVCTGYWGTVNTVASSYTGWLAHFGAVMDSKRRAAPTHWMPLPAPPLSNGDRDAAAS